MKQLIERIDFTDCRRILTKAYNGANGKKIAVEYAVAFYSINSLFKIFAG